MINLVPPNGKIRVIFPTSFTLQDSIIQGRKNIDPILPTTTLLGTTMIEFTGTFE